MLNDVHCNYLLILHEARRCSCCLFFPLSHVVFFYFFFFFQAEDGIRDIGVTGVQTCALPISQTSPAHRLAMVEAAVASNEFFEVDGREVAAGRPSYTVDTLTALRAELGGKLPLVLILGTDAFRSEERRVGKECRARRAAYHEE